MINIKKVILIGALIGFANATVYAEDNPAKVLNDVAESTPKLDANSESNEAGWKDWVNSQPWGGSDYIGGVQFFSERDIVVSAGIAYVNVRIGQPGWNESRIAAYERAELAARTKIVSFLSESLESERSASLLEKTQFTDGQIQEVQDISEVKTALARFVRKGVALTDALLDAGISKLDPSYDPAAFEKLTKPQQKVVVEEIFKRSISRVALRSLVGVSTGYNAEGFAKAGEKGQYEILVGVIWSPNLGRVAASLTNDVYHIPAKVPGKNINQWVDALGARLIGMSGSRIMVDENGQYNVITFAQAEPRRSSPSRTESALRNAKDIAANRGRAMLSNFAKETVSLSENETSQEIFQELEDMSRGTETVRDFQRIVKGHRNTIKMRGVRVIKEWSMDHPKTGQKVAGAVVIWSPSGLQMSGDMDNAMRQKPVQSTKGTMQEKTTPLEGRIESVPIDTSAY